MSDGFENVHAVVTGGTGALGRAVVRRLAESGAGCVVPCFDESELEAFELGGHERVEVVRGVDLTDEGQVTRLYERFGGRGPRLWASLHLAGGFAMSPVADTPAADFERMMRMNALTCFLCCREAVRRMREGGGGRIVNVAARPALDPAAGAGMAAYTASKAAVGAITAALGAELAAEGILVNAVAPSIIDTPANRRSMPDADHARWPKPEAIAETICFLASPRNRTTRGGVVPVYGAA